MNKRVGYGLPFSLCKFTNLKENTMIKVINLLHDLLIITIMTFLYVSVVIGLGTVIWLLFGAI